MPRFLETFGGWSGAIARLLFPPSCPFCLRDLDGDSIRPRLCERCAVTLAPPGMVRCPRCGRRVPPGVPCASDCQYCRGRRPPYEAVWTLGTYDDLLRRAVLRGKRPAGQILVAALTRLSLERNSGLMRAWKPDLLVPAPLFWARRVWRGANSPETMAESLSRDLHLPAAPFAVRRRRWTRPQASLPQRERTANVRGAFRANRRCDFSGARVLLVDDILTSGATLSELAKVVRHAGASAVAAVVLARAEEPV